MRNVEIEVGTPRPCPRCEDVVLLAVTIPHHPVVGGQRVEEGYRTVVLCPSCDAGDPAAQGILTFFAVHEKITADNLQDLAVLSNWLDHIEAHPPQYTEEHFAADLADWDSENE